MFDYTDNYSLIIALRILKLNSKHFQLKTYAVKPVNQDMEKK